MNEDKVIEIIDREFYKYGSVWIELHCGTEFEVAGTDCKIYGSKLIVYNKNKLIASVYLDDIRHIGTIGVII
jgi:hypothetical protein